MLPLLDELQFLLIRIIYQSSYVGLFNANPKRILPLNYTVYCIEF